MKKGISILLLIAILFILYIKFCRNQDGQIPPVNELQPYYLSSDFRQLEDEGEYAVYDLIKGESVLVHLDKTSEAYLSLSDESSKDRYSYHLCYFRDTYSKWKYELFVLDTAMLKYYELDLKMRFHLGQSFSFRFWILIGQHLL